MLYKYKLKFILLFLFPLFIFNILFINDIFAGVIQYNDLKSKIDTNKNIEETNEEKNNTEKNNTEKSYIPSSVMQEAFPQNIDIEKIVENAGLLELGENNIPPEPILNSTPWIHYRFSDINNIPIQTTESINNTYLFNKSGFSRLFISHNNQTPTDRYYFRVYTKNQSWLPWCVSNEASPNNNENDKIQAIQIRAKGYVTSLADIYYKAVLNDGTILGWAKNGQTLGNIGGDRYIVALKISLWNKNIPFTFSTSPLTQSEFYDGLYIDENNQVQYSTANGAPYTGWVNYENEQYYFKDGKKVNSWQYINGYKYLFKEDGRLDKDLEDDLGLLKDYQINYNLGTRTMYIMAKDGKNGYIIPYKTFNSSSGPDTPIGNYKTYFKYRWKLMHDNIYCQFLTRFNGHFLIHSILYENAPNSYRLDNKTYNGLDNAISQGCIRLLSGDAAWLYHNIPLHTTIHIYSNIWDKGPVEKSAIEKPIPENQTFDPTDPAIINK